MADQIVAILNRFRRRLVLVRVAEAAGVAAAGGGLTASGLMGAWVLAGRYPLAAAGLCAAVLGAGVAVSVWRRVRTGLHPEPLVQWIVALVPAVAGAAGGGCVLAGVTAAVAKNSLAMIVPGAAALAVAAVLWRAASLASVAASVDARAGLRERLRTALETPADETDESFAVAVRAQAVQAASHPDVRAVRFWTRSRATIGAVGLALAATALMLPWEPLLSPAAAETRRWRQVGSQAGRSLEEALAALVDPAAGGDAEIASHVGRLEQLASALQSARPVRGGAWRETALDLDRVTAALRRAVASGRLDAATAEKMTRLADALERIGAEIALKMGGEDVARANDGAVPPPPPAPTTGPAGWTTVYDPRYATLATMPATGAATVPMGAAPVVGQSFDAAWADAQARANRALDRGNVPAEYRQLVRDFFATPK